ncbi:MAG: aminotransferase class I/II-fold pyridoxal phosphate-dependent enzyme [Vicinamibacteria bacterium]
MKIDLFEMERMQSLHWHRVRYDLSESGVIPLRLDELLTLCGGRREILRTRLGYPLSEGSEELRSQIARWYPSARVEHVTVVNGGSEANHLALWTLLEPGARLAFMAPNYMQGWGLGRQYAGGTDLFHLKPVGRAGHRRWGLDLESLERAVGPKTRVIMVCNPNNPTGAVLTVEEMESVVRLARRHRAWILADEIYRGAEVPGQPATPTFWGRYDRVVVTSGLSKAFALPGLRVGWLVAPPRLIREIWKRHDYTTLTPGMLSDRLATRVLAPAVRERLLRRTRAIIGRNLPRLEEWLARHDDVLDYVRPQAGAIAFVRYRPRIGSQALVDRMRQRQSVLLVPGDQFRGGRGLRFGFGYDIGHTLEGLARVSRELRRAR